MKKKLMKTLRAILLVNLSLSLFMFFGIESLMDRTEPNLALAIGIIAWLIVSVVSAKAVIRNMEELEDGTKH